MKFCKKCKLEKENTEFGKDRRNSDNLTFYCKSCKSEIKKLSYQKGRIKFNTYNRNYHRIHAKEISEKKKKRRAELSPEKNRESHRKWAQKNPGMVNFLASKKRARRRNATPTWLSQDHWIQIKDLYKNCPKGWHVDHIVPLLAVNSENEHIACGLHVPWNLQLLPASENIKKKNRL
jgi:hypothetical protein